MYPMAMIGRRWTKIMAVVAVSVVWILLGAEGNASLSHEITDITHLADKDCPPLPVHIIYSNITLVAPSKARISCLPGHHLFPGGNSKLTCLRFKWMADDLVYRWCRPSCPASCPSSQCERPGVCMCSDVPCLMFGHVLPGDEVDVKVKGAVILPGGIGGALGTCEMGFEVSHGVSQFVVPFVHGQWVVPRTGSGATLACHRANNSSFSGLAGAPNETLECRSHFTCHDKPHIPPGMTLAHLDCTTFILKCKGNKTLKGGDEGKTPMIRCVSGSWVKVNWNHDKVLTCEQDCDVPCLNGGVCDNEGRCRCPDGFYDRHCQRISCPSLPPQIPNGTVYKDEGDAQFRLSDWQVECNPGYRLASGRKGRQRLMCSLGKWVMLTENNQEEVRCVKQNSPRCFNAGQFKNGKCVCSVGTTGKLCEGRLCADPKPHVFHGFLDHSSFPSLFMRCLPGYAMPKGEVKRQVLCNETTGEWIVPSNTRCDVVCNNTCYNGGSCDLMSMCRCKEGFAGERCQNAVTNEYKCKPPLPEIPYAETIDSNPPYIQCYPNYTLPSGKTNATLRCYNNLWGLQGESEIIVDTLIALNCSPICHPNCKPPKVCASPGICICPFHLEGDQCQYPITHSCDEPPSVPNAFVERNTGFVTCRKGFGVGGFYTVTKWLAHCYYSVWISPYPLNEGCKPLCNPECSSNGVCMDINYCLCSEHYCGRTCEIPIFHGPYPIIDNGHLDNCHNDVMAKCLSGYNFEDGRSEISLVSTDHSREIESNQPYNMTCYPNCTIPCVNGGECVEYNYCECSEGYLGKFCQYVSCDMVPINLLNNVVQKSNNILVVECLRGLTFPNGERRLTFKCNGEYWIFPDKYNSTSDMHCTKNCEEPCQNGGTCEMLGHCRCPSGFTGHVCESRICNDFVPTIVNGTYSFINDSVLVNCTGSAYSYWITCENGIWEGDSASEDAPCPIICPLNCKHGGTCILPGACVCTEDYTGLVCENRLYECLLQPPLIVNSDIVYNYRNATVECHDGFAFWNNATTLNLGCKLNKWHAVEMDYIPKICYPFCEPPCQNDGICLGGNQCLCPRGLTGPTCEKGSLCISPPEVPPNMELKNISGGVYMATCKKNHTFSSPDISSLTITCEAGVWSKSHVYVCNPVCTLPCQNGGICTGVNICRCPGGTQGPTCGTLVLGKCRADVKWQNVRITAVNKTEKLIVTCNPGNTLWPPDLGDNWKLVCKDGKWSQVPVKFDEEFPCVPRCDPPCLGGGKCIAPSQCYCGNGVFMGDCTMRKWCNRSPLIINGLAYRLAPRLMRVACLEGRLTYGGSRNVVLRCFGDYWITASKTPTIVNDVRCNFTCNPRCKNGGRCVGHNMCSCNNGYAGPFCDYPGCGTAPLRVQHGQLNVTYESSAEMVFGTVRCNDEYRMASGEQETNFQCLDGKWYFSGDMSGHKLLECHPLCSPPCVNRGTCVAPGHCLCSGGFTGKYCEMRPTMAVSGIKCKFPFLYGHEMHISCITYNSKIPWCATQVNVFGEPVSIDYCNATHYLEEVVETISGRTCAFPFKAKGIMFWECVQDDKERSWCATHVSGTGDVLQWDYCWLDHGPTMAVSGIKCKFPFLYGHEMHISCITYNSKIPWCATQVNVFGEPVSIDYCNATHCYQRVTVTKNGMMCHFPYFHDDVLYFSCYGDAKDPEMWCPTETMDDLTPLQWGVCRRGESHFLHNFPDNVPLPAKPRPDLLPVPQLELVPRNQLVTPSLQCPSSSSLRLVEGSWTCVPLT